MSISTTNSVDALYDQNKVRRRQLCEKLRDKLYWIEVQILWLGFFSFFAPKLYIDCKRKQSAYNTLIKGLPITSVTPASVATLMNSELIDANGSATVKEVLQKNTGIYRAWDNSHKTGSLQLLEEAQLEEQNLSTSTAELQLK